jgi:DNA invertase Pin-like site-specific DNA recombinase
MSNYVVYYRISTSKQDRSGLGLEAQKTLVAQLPKNGPVLAEYTEVESGKRSDRPELQKALAHARATDAILLIATLSRLARNVAFTANLMDSGVEFICADIPSANRLTLHILAAVAEEESRLVSERTKAALAEAKKHGVKLGSHRPGFVFNDMQAAHEALRKKRAQQEPQYEILIPMVRQLREQGCTMKEIRDWLNERGFKTSRKMPFTEGRVWSIIAKYLGREYLGKAKRLGVTC